MTSLRDITVIYHHEAPYGWWCESPDVPNWSGAANTLPELLSLASDGVRFALETDAVNIIHLLGDVSTMKVTTAAGVSGLLESDEAGLSSSMIDATFEAAV